METYSNGCEIYGSVSLDTIKFDFPISEVIITEEDEAECKSKHNAATKQDLSKMVVRMNKTVYSKCSRQNNFEEFKKGAIIEKTRYVKRIRKCVN